MHTIGFKALQRLVCIEAGCVPHVDHVNVEAISKDDTLLKFDQNRKRLRESYKK